MKLYKALSIPVGVIADIDLLTDPDTLCQVLARVAPQKSREQIVKATQAVVKRLRGLPPVLTEDSVREKLKQLLNKEVDWDHGGDTEIRGELESISRKIARSRKLKNVDTIRLPSDLRQDIEQCLKSLREYGIFLVPVGQLEDWLPGQDLGSRNRKAEFAVAASAWIQEHGHQQDPLWDFVGNIAEYFSRTHGL